MNDSAPIFLGRTRFCEETMTYSFSDGSGVVPEEMRLAVEDAVETRYKMKNGSLSGNGIAVLGTLFSWQDRLAEIGKMKGEK